MEFDLSNSEDITKARIRFQNALENKSRIELKKLQNKRTITQNSALHKFFVLISFALNESGQEFNFTGLKGINISTMYTPNIVKDCFWRPIQMTLFDIESTKDINTEQINKIADVIIKFFGEKGVFIQFPSMESLKNNRNDKN